MAVVESFHHLLPNVVAEVISDIQLVGIDFCRGLFYRKIKVCLSLFHEIVDPVTVGFDIALRFEEIGEFDFFRIAEFHFQTVDIEFHFHVDVIIIDRRVDATAQQEGCGEQIKRSLQERTEWMSHHNEA